MLQFLETGKALYVLAAVCILSLAGKFITRNLYKRMIKESDNMALTKNKYLRTLKQKAENTYRMNQGIANTKVYLEKQLLGIKFLGASLQGWGNFSNQMTLLCFLLGGVGAFGAYWFRSDSYYIVMYGSVGILAGLFSIVIDSGMNLSDKRMQLMISLQDYLENSLFGRITKEQGTSMLEEDSGTEAMRGKAAGGGRVMGKSQDRDTAAVTAIATATTGKRTSRVSRRETPQTTEPQETGNRKDIDYLKRSLDQIAASRERNKTDDNWTKDLNSEEVKLIGEILREYLA